LGKVTSTQIEEVWIGDAARRIDVRTHDLVVVGAAERWKDG
jgi:hypothetical protein